MRPFADHFSAIASAYAAARPTYPSALFDWLAHTVVAHGARLRTDSPVRALEWKRGNVRVEGDSFAFQLYLGPTFSFLVKCTGEAGNFGSENCSDEGIKSFDLGGDVGAGLRFGIGNGAAFLIDGFYDFGFQTIDSDNSFNQLDVKNEVISVTAGVVEPRYPSFKGIMAAKNKPVDQVTAADLGLGADQVGWTGSRQEITSVAPAPAREAGEKIEDDGAAFERIVGFLEALKVV